MSLAKRWNGGIINGASKSQWDFDTNKCHRTHLEILKDKPTISDRDTQVYLSHFEGRYNHLSNLHEENILSYHNTNRRDFVKPCFH